MNIDEFDLKETYCGKLGHTLSFKYCRCEKADMPCQKVINCWFEKIPIQDFIKNQYDQKQIAYIFEPPQSKISNILEIIQKIKN